ncbi:MAG: spermidine/putrescine ABC transporter substrate-binding protein [Kiritimatiellae bacterium]|nr:spermidine/putrescine ABC transporter substrate-binding protein [Kiritimatiellia bacterium]
MKPTSLFIPAILATAILAGCGPKKPTLHLYTWSDYIDPGLVTLFEKENNCRVKIDTFDSNETMYAKVKAGSGGYDIIFPSSYQVSLMAQNNMLLPLDKSKLPNVTAHFEDFYKRVILNPEMTFNVPYAVTFTGIAYRKDKTAGVAIDSWACLDNPAFKGRVSLLNDFRETIGAALKSLGYSLNSTSPDELRKACDVVLRWKKNIAKFDNEQYKTGIASGEFLLGHGYSGDIAQVMLEDPANIGFAFPKEGFTAACDEMVIPKTAKEPTLAHAFINFLYEPDNASRNIQYICAVMPNKEGISKLPDEYRNNPAILPPADVLAKAEVLKDLGANNALYSKVWDTIKATE